MRVTPPSTLAELRLYLDAVVRAYGEDVPLWLVTTEKGQPTMVPLSSVQLSRTNADPAILLLGLGTLLPELPEPGNVLAWCRGTDFHCCGRYGEYQGLGNRTRQRCPAHCPCHE